MLIRNYPEMVITKIFRKSVSDTILWSLGCWVLFVFFSVPYKTELQRIIPDNWFLLTGGWIGSVLILFLSVIFSSGLRINLRKADIAIGLCFVWLFLRIEFSTPVYYGLLAENICLLLLYLLSRKIPFRLSVYILWCLPLIVLYRLWFGWEFQLGRFLPGSHLYDLSGGFINTSLWGGFLAFSLVFLLGIGINRLKRISHLWIIWLLSVCILTLLLLYSDSRAAWLSFGGGMFYLIYFHFRSKICPFVLRYKWCTIVGGGMLLLLLGTGLYSYRPASADGRLLIYRVTCDMILDVPWAGFGPDGFRKNYMDYQAAYFQRYPTGKEVLLADEVTFAFNEFLKLLTEQGIFFGIFVLILIVCIFLHPVHTFACDRALLLRSMLLTLLVFGSYSYPFSFFIFKAWAIIITGMLISSFTFDFPVCSWRLGNIGKMFISVCCTGIMISGYLFLQQRQEACTKANEALIHYHDNPENALKVLGQVSTGMEGHAVFLFVYGRALNKCGDYREALCCLQKSLSFQASYQTCIELGKSFEGCKQYTQAELYWQRAGKMIPVRFLPDYLSARMYFTLGDTVRARRIAQKTLRKPIKTKSPEIRFIFKELRRMVSF